MGRGGVAPPLKNPCYGSEDVFFCTFYNNTSYLHSINPHIYSDDSDSDKELPSINIRGSALKVVVTDVAEENSARETENDWVSTEMKPVTDYYIGYVTYMYISMLWKIKLTRVWYIYYVHTHNIISFVVLGRSFIS